MLTKNVIKVCKVFSMTGKYLKLASNKEADLDNLKISWSNEIISLFKMKIKIIGNPMNVEEAFLLVGNHISYLDIPILLNSVPEISFVCKNEVKSWPIIGQAASKAQTIFVERNNGLSRSLAKNKIASTLMEKKPKVVIFPSGTTSIKTSSSWKKGAFEIAENYNIKLQPFRIKYHPLRHVAYVGNDNLLIHMYQLLHLDEINVTLEFHEAVSITNILEDCSYWKNWCEQ